MTTPAKQGTTRCIGCGKDRGENFVCCSQKTLEDGSHLWPACKRCCWRMNHDPRPVRGRAMEGAVP